MIELDDEIKEFLSTNDGKLFIRATFPEIPEKNRNYKIKSQIYVPQQV